MKLSDKVHMSFHKTLVASIMGGFFIALGALGYQMCQVLVEGGSGKLIGSFVFSIGLFLVVSTRSELITGNCLLIIPLFNKEITFYEFIRSFCIVLLGNSLGSLIFSLIVKYANISGLSLVANIIAYNKSNLSSTEIICRAILCNILVCLAVFIAGKMNSNVEKFVPIFISVGLFVLCGFEHFVANEYFLTIGIATVSSTLYNLILSLIGNMIGGYFIGWYLWYRDK